MRCIASLPSASSRAGERRTITPTHNSRLAAADDYSTLSTSCSTILRVVQTIDAHRAVKRHRQIREDRARGDDGRMKNVLAGVESAPVIIKGPQDANALVGDRVLLKITYTGSPPPTVKWTRAGRELKNDERTCITSSDGQCCLLLQNITTDDSGKYDVCIENKFGADAHYASVSVEGPPDPPNGKPCILADGAQTTVTWSSSPYDGGCKITGYTVEYSLAGSEIWHTACDDCHSLRYILHGLQPGARYVVRIRANNIHGSSNASQESDVLQMEEENIDSSFEPRLVQLEQGTEFKQKYDIQETLGKGRFGIVHKVVDRKTNQIFAAKFIRCRSAKEKDKVKEEIDIMNQLRHEQLLQLAAAFDHPKEMIMVMEFISGGELFERVVADDFTLTEKDCILFMRQICEGVVYMHSQNIVHLDLKPENIMCHTRTSHEIKIIDFGLAQKLDPDKPVRVLFGTPEFISPEIINYEPIGVASDMWSLGVICYVLLSGLSPFMGETDADTFANITRAEYDFDDEAFDAVTQNARDFIGGLLRKRKEERMSAAESLRHSWLDPESHQNTVVISTDKLKKFIIRRKWQKTGNAIRALGRMATLSASRRNSNTTNAPTILPSQKMNETNTSTGMSSVDEEEDPIREKRVVRNRNFSERSDSGISDCLTVSQTSSNTHPISITNESNGTSKHIYNSEIAKIKEEVPKKPIELLKYTKKHNEIPKFKQTDLHLGNVENTKTSYAHFKTEERPNVAPNSVKLSSPPTKSSIANVIQRFDQLDRVASQGKGKVGQESATDRNIMAANPSFIRKVQTLRNKEKSAADVKLPKGNMATSVLVRNMKNKFEKPADKSETFKKVSEFWNNHA